MHIDNFKAIKNGNSNRAFGNWKRI